MIGGARLVVGIAVATSLSVTAPSAGSAPSQQDATSIDSGESIERSVAIGEEHRYRLTLAAGEMATAIVDQRGVDVVVQARHAWDTDTVEFQEEVRRNGQEQADIVADKPGVYSLTIAPSAGIYTGTYAIRVVARRTATDSDRSMFEARRLRTSGIRLRNAARFSEAQELFERAIAHVEAVRGPDDVLVGILLHDLVGAILEKREFTQAQIHTRRAQAIFEKSWGSEHPYSAMSQMRLAVVLLQAGQLVQAETLLTSSSRQIEQALGPEHTWFATCLRLQASLRYNGRDLNAAEQLYRRSMAILERVGDAESPAYTAVLNNLALIDVDRGEFGRAEDYFLRALALAERLEGRDGYHISLYLQNLGAIARARQDFAKALEDTTRALTIRQGLVGPEHIDIAPILTTLATIYRASGDMSRATDTFLRALQILERDAGPYHGLTLRAVGNVAHIYWDAGDVSRAIPVQRRYDSIIEKQIELNLAVGSERQKLAFVRSISERTDTTISMHLRGAPGDPQAAAQAARVVLQRKGRVLDAVTDSFAALRRRLDDSRGRALLDQLNTTTAQLARLTLSAPDGASADDRRRSIGELEAARDRLETEIDTFGGDLRAQVQSVQLEAVQAALPGDAALLEFAVFRPFDPKAETGNAYGPPHYAAYVVRRNAAPRGVDLGPVTAIDRAIDDFRHAIRDRTRTDVKARARAVHDLLTGPLQTFYGDASRLLISPDGALNLVPFEALVDTDGRYLIERFAIGYLSSGRDLLRLDVPRQHRSPPVIVAAPHYGEPPLTGSATAARTRSRTPDIRNGTTLDAADLYFPALANTGEEGRAIKRLFPEGELLTGQQATKAAVARLDGPLLVHIASHGFFLQDADRSVRPEAGTATASLDNPLLRSGIALAGANLGRERRGDGILTALEASNLNLWGTKLVTLSACDTGIGEVRNGEGVYGLRRAFMLAGTETLVMSLWPVSDYVARETMIAYYAGLRDGLGRGEALRQAKLAMLKRKSRQHPFFWASFIQAGEWASLDGKR